MRLDAGPGIEHLRLDVVRQTHGLAHGRSRQAQLIRVAQLSRQLGFFRARLHLYREACSCFRFVHFTSARRLATPAADFASTTSNAMASSTQSWLEPSAFCVATVSVYSCGVSQQS